MRVPSMRIHKSREMRISQSRGEIHHHRAKVNNRATARGAPTNAKPNLLHKMFSAHVGEPFINTATRHRLWVSKVYADTVFVACAHLGGRAGSMLPVGLSPTYAQTKVARSGKTDERNSLFPVIPECFCRESMVEPGTAFTSMAALKNCLGKTVQKIYLAQRYFLQPHCYKNG